MKQNQAPLYQALRRYLKKAVTKLHVPGHRYGRGLPRETASLDAKFDLTLLEDIDSLSHPQSAIKQAQELTAEAFGAEETLFLVGGSTLGVISMILSTCSPNDKILISRNMHKSAVSGLIISGAQPIYLQPEFDQEFNLPLNVKPETVAKSLKEHPDAKAVLIVNPTQFGVTADLEKIAAIVHKAGKILLVDEAWGAHLKFNSQFPQTALAAGADAVVQSTHKRLPALSQSSMLHFTGKRIDRQKVKETVRLLQTTSPSYIFLASLDLVRRQMVLQGKKLWQGPIDLAQKAREFLKNSQLRCIERNYLNKKGFDLDLTNLTVEVENGFESWEILNKNKIEPEFSTPNHLIFIFGIGNDARDLNAFFNVLKKLSARKGLWAIEYPFIVPQISLSPRKTFLKETEEIKIEEAIGRIAAEVITPYPPGIPLLVPGEVITPQIHNYFEIVRHYSSIFGLSKTIKVVK